MNWNCFQSDGRMRKVIAVQRKKCVLNLLEVNGNKSEKNFQISLFQIIDSPYIKWIKEQAGGFMDDDKLIHFMIVSADYVLDTVSKYEPDKYYLSKLTCSDSTKISL